MLGFFSFTEITDPAAHAAYNAWHQFDHLPEQFSIDGITFGQRWVCSPRCVRSRVSVSPLLERCHYMTLYLMRDEGVLPEFFALARTLRAAGRFFEPRESHLSGPFRVHSTLAWGEAGVSAAAVPFRPAEGVFVVVGPVPPTGPSEALVGPAAGVAGEWGFVDFDERRHISVAFVDGDLWETSARLATRCAQLGQPLEWAGPLERVDPGHWDWFD